MKILMVCLGNICRSPLAEGILRHKAKQHGLHHWQIDSAGTGAYHVGERPDRRSIHTAAEHGLDISSQRARQFQQADFDEFDKIYVMDSANYQDVLRLARTDADRQKVDLVMNAILPPHNINVPDPYTNDRAFEGVFQMLYRAADAIIEQFAPKI